MPVRNRYGKIHEVLHARCSELHFQPPWDFLPPDGDSRGPVCDPAQTLAALRKEFSDAMLARAGVLDCPPGGQSRLSPELTNPLGAVIALRDHPGRKPFALLTARGCLRRAKLPIRAVLQDDWTAEKLARGGVLFATPHVREVTLLRALRFPATLATGTLRLRSADLRKLDAEFGGQDFVPEAPEEGADSPRPTLALLGWSPWSLTAQPSPALSHAVAHLAAVRRHLGLALTGLMAWQIRPEELENLRFRLSFRDRPLIRRVLLESANDLVDFECLARPSGGTTQAVLEEGYVAAQADLLAALAADRESGGLPHRVRAAWAAFEAVVQKDLIEPLQQWASQSDDPVIYNVGVELANVCGLLHRIAPRLHVLQAGHLEEARQADVEPVPPRMLAQYLALAARCGSLLKDLCLWRKT